MRAEPRKALVRYRAELPALGPVLVYNGAVPCVSLGADPQLGDPELMCLVPMRRAAGRGWEMNGALLASGVPPAEFLQQCGAADWYSKRLPDWIVEKHVRHVAVLLLYPQGQCIGRPTYDPGMVARALAPRTIANGGHKFLGEEIGDDNHKPADARQLRAQARAIRGAMRRFKLRKEAFPPGLLELNWGQRADGLRLALGSCQYPPGIVNQFPGYESWQHLNARVGQAGEPELIVLTGDQIYADATAGLFDPGQLDDRYRKPYETLLGNRQVRDVLGRIPMVTTLDDHEIDDNWEPISPACPPDVVARNISLREAGLEAFLRYQRPPGPGGRQPPATEPLWFELTRNGIPMFVVDSRSKRELRAANAPRSSMLGKNQQDELHAWLRGSDPDIPKLIVSASVLLPRHRRAVPAHLANGSVEVPGAPAALRSDGWDGYPETFHALLALIAQHGLRRLVFLSGDEHLGLHATATLSGGPRGPVIIHSIHGPGLNTPYRFANANQSDLVLDESFAFAGEEGTYACAVATRVFEGAGFVMIAVEKNGKDGWELRVGFPGTDSFRVALK